MKRLDEKWLICAALKFCFIPCFVFVLISSYFPYPQALIPAVDSVYCMCHYLNPRFDVWYENLMIFNADSQSDFLYLQIINTICFFGLNWVFLFMNIRNVWHVRHIKDRLEIRKEMT